MTAQSSSDFNANQAWIMDTGATHHMTEDLHDLNVVTPFEGDQQITVGSGECLPVKHTGSNSLHTSSKTLNLLTVLHVPNLAASLLSIYTLCKDNKCYVIMDEFGFWVQDKAIRAILMRGMSSGGLYYIPKSLFFKHNQLRQSESFPKAYLGKLVQASLWHHRLGHPSNAVLHSMLSHSQIVYRSDKNQHVYSDCLSGKMSRQSFSSSSHISVRLFERVCSDVWGPSPVVSIEGYKYYVIFVDDFTKFTWFFPLTYKSQVASVFEQFYAFIQNHFKTSVQYFQSDGGSEYMSSNFQKFLKARGIIHLVSYPYTPQQNRMAERKHRHIIETAITLLNSAKLPHNFWTHACIHAIFLINRMSCSSLDMNSPYFKLFGSHPVLHSVKVFGTAVYPYLRPYVKNKLEPRTEQCVFLGYMLGYKGVVCYHRSRKRLFISRHVFSFSQTMHSSKQT